MNDTEILDYLEFLAHGYKVTLTRDWMYELIINDKEPVQGRSIRECIESIKSKG